MCYTLPVRIIGKSKTQVGGLAQSVRVMSCVEVAWWSAMKLKDYHTPKLIIYHTNTQFGACECRFSQLILTICMYTSLKMFGSFALILFFASLALTPADGGNDLFGGVSYDYIDEVSYGLPCEPPSFYISELTHKFAPIDEISTDLTTQEEFNLLYYDGSNKQLSSNNIIGQSNPYLKIQFMKFNTVKFEVTLHSNRYLLSSRFEIYVVGGDNKRRKRSLMNLANKWVLGFALNFVSDGEVAREVGGEFQKKGFKKFFYILMVASEREQDMEIYEKKKGNEQLDEQQSFT
ncbi:hypothetical protein HELRODRAFT_172902 [Helobdella robusta]|uniref:Uncharacterized protein n=1 Tax=Helobdella robusta TaxID=6412 RepID=T1F637_HELRO|nr:hypothetical protein HELRODRAFT_172902 [Helobdella robusta]ESO03877.1 hypothetical protein HELRODRAFT_172902 [Helobdella robusta]